VVGEEGCVRLSDTGYVSLPAAEGWLNPGGFSFLLDFQADVPLEQTVFGARDTGGSAIVFTQHVRGEANTMCIEVGDARGGRVVVDAVGSASQANGFYAACTREMLRWSYSSFSRGAHAILRNSITVARTR
jgi:hypothetical protein